jgi:hypothetical protein
MSDDRRYTDDEARSIIDRALRSQLIGEITHQDLVHMASEVGLSEDSVEAAARQVRVARLADEAKQRVVGRRRRALASHLWVFLAVNAMLFAINALTTPGQWWMLFPLVSWGVGLAIHARFGLSTQVSERSLWRENERIRGEEHARLYWSGAAERVEPTDTSRRVRIDGPRPDEDARDASDEQDRDEHDARDASDPNRSRA